jgi:hypothetical protein
MGDAPTACAITSKAHMDSTRIMRDCFTEIYPATFGQRPAVSDSWNRPRRTP